MKYLVLIIMCLVSSKAVSETAVGLGFGIPYGMFGLNVDHTISEGVDLSLGLGTTLFAGGAYSLGAKYYLNSSESGARFSIYYGTNSMVEVTSCSWFCFDLGDYEKYEGITLGFGWGHRAERSGWDIDIMYVATTGADERIDELRSQGFEYEKDNRGLGLSFGYHWAL